MPILVPALAFSGAVAFQTEAQANPPSPKNPSQNQATIFLCVSQDSAFATVAERGSRRSTPMIIWESYVFGLQYTPKQRCEIVAQKLTTAVAQNGGRLRNLLLTSGRVNGQTVICYAKTADPICNSSNLLFTLKPENAKDPGAVLASLLRFGQGAASGSPLRESAGGEDEDEDVAVDLEAAVEEAFTAGSREAGDDFQ
jgi:hypothetical protein